MKRLNGLFLLSLVLCLTFIICQNACDQNDDSDNSEPADDDANDDDAGDDDADDDDEVGVYYRYTFEPDSNCPILKPQEYLGISNPSTCWIQTDGMGNIDMIYPALRIVIYFFDGYPLEGVHQPREIYEFENSNASCAYGFHAFYYFSGADDDYVMEKLGYVEFRETAWGYKVEFSIEFADGLVREGVWAIEACGEPVPE